MLRKSFRIRDLMASKFRKNRLARSLKSRRPRRQAAAAMESLEARTLLAAFGWTAAADGDWSNSANWTVTSGSDADGVPDADDAVTFNAVSGANATIDVDFSVQSLTVAADYTGVINAGASVLSTTNGFSVASPTAFDAGTGTVRLAGSQTVNSAAAVNNLTITGNAAVSLTADLNVSGDLTLDNVASLSGTGNINVSSDVMANDAQYTGSSFVSLVGSTDQTLSGSGAIYRLDVSKSGGNVLLPADFKVGNYHQGSLRGSGNIRNTGGTLILTAGNGSWNVSSNFSGTVDDLRLTNTSTVSLNQALNVNDTLTIDNSIAAISGADLKVSGDVTTNDVQNTGSSYISLVGGTDQTLLGSGSIYKLDVSKPTGDVLLPADFKVGNYHQGSLRGSGNIRNTGGTLVLTAGNGSWNVSSNFSGTVDDLRLTNTSTVSLTQALSVNDTLTIDNSIAAISGADLKVSGDVTVNDTLAVSSAYISLVGSADQTLTGTGAIYKLDISKPAGDVLLPTDFKVGNYHLGALRGSGNIRSTGGTLILTAGNGNWNVSSNFSGTVDDLRLTNTSTVSLNQALNVNDTLTIDNSIAAIIGADLKVSGDVTSNDTNYGGSASVSLAGSADQTLSGTGTIYRLDVSKSGGDVLFGGFNTNFNQVTVSAGQWDVLGNTVAASSGFIAQGGDIVGTGTLNGNVTANNGGGIAPGNSPGILTINGNLSLNSGSTLDIEINGDTPGTQHDQLVVNGGVAINGATLTGATEAVPSGPITIIANDGTDGVSGTKFAGTAEGSVVSIGSQDYEICYVGDTGNDVVLTPHVPNVAPVINDQSFTLDENSANGTVVGTVVGKAAASDDDLAGGDVLTWSITGGNTGGAFAIDSANCQITVATSAAVDFETTPSFSLTVQVEDSYGETDSATVTIDLDDLQSTLSVSDASVTEGGDLEFTVSLSSPVAYDTVISYSTADGTATDADNDYTPQVAEITYNTNPFGPPVAIQSPDPTLTIPAGQTRGTITVATTDDSKVELDETLSVNVTGVSGTNDVSISDGTGAGTIENDDSATVTIDDASVVEGGNLEFNVSLSNPVDVDTVINYSTADGTATTAGSDYTGASGSITIAAGLTSGTITVATTGDNTVELDETVNVTVHDVVADGRDVGGSAGLSVLDNFNDGVFPGPWIGATTNYSESGGLLHTPAGGPEIIMHTGAVVPNSFTPFTASIDFQRNYESGRNESLWLTYGDQSNPAGSQALVSYWDNYNSGSRLFGPGNSSDFYAPQLNADGTVMYRMSASVEEAATAGQYVWTVDITDLSTSTSVLHATSTTTFYPFGKTLGLAVRRAEGGADNFSINEFSVQGVGTTGTILNDDSATVSVSDASVVEGGNLDFNVTLNNPVDVDTVVNFSTADGSATTADSDYTPTSGSITIAAGQTTGTISVATTGDNTVELDETLSLNLTAVNASGRTVSIDDGTGTGTIENDDSATVSIGDASVVEGGNLEFDVTLSNPVDVDTVINYSTADGSATTADSDYTGGSGSITIAAGLTSGTITVATTDDNTVELDEVMSLDVVLADSSDRDVAFPQVGANIVFEDTFDSESVGVGYTSLTNWAVTSGNVDVIGDGYHNLYPGNGRYLDMDGYANGTIQSDPLTLNPGVYELSFEIGNNTFGGNGLLVSLGSTFVEHFPASSTLTPVVRTITVTEATTASLVFEETGPSDKGGSVLDDVRLIQVSGAGSLSGQSTGTILNDDSATVSIGDASVAEGGNLEFNVSLSNPVDVATVVNYSTADGSADGSDYTAATGSITIAAGQTTGTISVATSGDNTVELDETLSLNLTAVSASGRTVSIDDGTGAGTIEDDDSASLSIGDVVITEGDSGTTTATFTVTLNNAVDAGVSVKFDVTDGTATEADGDYSAGNSFGTGGLVFGGVDAARGGATSMADGYLMANIRADISANSPGATFTSSNTLTPAYLDTIDVLFVSSWPTVVTLSAAEQAAVANFVQNGGGAIIWGENDGWAGGASDISNESLIDPFLMDITGTLGGGQTVTVTNPSAHIVTDGPFGTVTSFGLSWPGWFNNLGPYATTLGTLNANGQSALAVIDPGAINPGSGGVVLISDGNGTSGAPLVRTLILNSLSFVSTSAPDTLNFSGAAGETQTIEVEINGDNTVELDENFFVTLSNLDANGRNVTLADSQGEGTIENDDYAPVANAGGAYVINEGDGLSLAASASTDADDGLAGLTFRWDVDGDGDYDENVTGATPVLTSAQMAALGLNDGPDSRTVTVEASDGTNIGTATTILTINNVAPDDVELNSGTINEGDAFTLTGSFIDPGQDTHTVDINWGDGTTETFALPAGARSFSFDHEYADDDPTGTPQDQYKISVAITDSDGDSNSGYAASGAAGLVVVNHDEWTLASGFSVNAANTTRFVQNLADYFTAGAGGDFLAYSSNFGLTGGPLANAMTNAGINWTVSTTTPFTLSNLQNYDAVFLGGNPHGYDAGVLTQYVNAGGNVYLMAGTGAGGAAGEAATWNAFLDGFGLNYAPS